MAFVVIPIKYYWQQVCLALLLLIALYVYRHLGALVIFVVLVARLVYASVVVVPLAHAVVVRLRNGAMVCYRGPTWFVLRVGSRLLRRADEGWKCDRSEPYFIPCNVLETIFTHAKLTDSGLPVVITTIVKWTVADPVAMMCLNGDVEDVLHDECMVLFSEYVGSRHIVEFRPGEYKLLKKHSTPSTSSGGERSPVAYKLHACNAFVSHMIDTAKPHCLICERRSFESSGIERAVMEATALARAHKAEDNTTAALIRSYTCALKWSGTRMPNVVRAGKSEEKDAIDAPAETSESDEVSHPPLPLSPPADTHDKVC